MISERFAKDLKLRLGDMVLGPQAPLIGRVRNYYIQCIILKIDWKNHSVLKVKNLLKEKVTLFESDKINKGAFIILDVDPY
jgi:primosomal protein N' (replication factor Y)